MIGDDKPETPVVENLFREEAVDLLEHFAKWLHANDVSFGINERFWVISGHTVHNKDLGADELVARYMELQWGEDREDTWGHAFTTS